MLFADIILLSFYLKPFDAGSSSCHALHSTAENFCFMVCSLVSSIVFAMCVQYFCNCVSVCISENGESMWCYGIARIVTLTAVYMNTYTYYIQIDNEILLFEILFVWKFSSSFTIHFRISSGFFLAKEQEIQKSEKLQDNENPKWNHMPPKRTHTKVKRMRKTKTDASRSCCLLRTRNTQIP